MSRPLDSAYRELPLGTLSIQNLREVDEGVWLGRLDMLRRSFHCELVRVATTPDGEQWVVGEPGGPAAEIFEAMQAFNDGHYETVQIPGVEGEFALFLFPYCD